MFGTSKIEMVTKENSLPDRPQAIAPSAHAIFDRPLLNASGLLNVPDEFQWILFGMGCFWGAERKFWQDFEIYLSAVGYAGGYTKNPTYQDVCSGLTGHTEVVAIVFSEEQCSLASLLRAFWTNHDPTQGMRQGNDRGTQYRSAIFCSSEEQLVAARRSQSRVDSFLKDKGRVTTTTEIDKGASFYFAEEYHQQYLHKNPAGYCGLSGMDVDVSGALQG